MNSSAPQEIEFRPVEASDFPNIHRVARGAAFRRFYQKTPGVSVPDSKYDCHVANIDLLVIPAALHLLTY